MLGLLQENVENLFKIEHIKVSKLTVDYKQIMQCHNARVMKVRLFTLAKFSFSRFGSLL